MQTNYQQIVAAQDDDGTPVTELIARYRAGHELLHRSLQGLDESQLDSRPVPGKLSSREVLAHIADCEQFYADRMKRTIAMDRPLLLAADGWLYPEHLHYWRREVQLDLELVRTTRAQMAHDLDALDSDAWARVAVHAETGLVTLRQLLLHAIRHLEWHVETIAEKRAAMMVER
ncbi:MAG: DinB family protein [Coriobacteriia bacterium]|nr:DinB family protein [Coriobacteriia bacterium]